MQPKFQNEPKNLKVGLSLGIFSPSRIFIFSLQDGFQRLMMPAVIFFWQGPSGTNHTKRLPKPFVPKPALLFVATLLAGGMGFAFIFTAARWAIDTGEAHLIDETPSTTFPPNYNPTEENGSALHLKAAMIKLSVESPVDSATLDSSSAIGKLTDPEESYRPEAAGEGRAVKTARPHVVGSKGVVIAMFASPPIFVQKIHLSFISARISFLGSFLPRPPAAPTQCFR
jgi:hypothetical protein